MNLIFQKKSYSFKLSAKVENSKTNYHTKSGWIIKLISNDKKIGFGEVSPLHKKDLKKCAKQLDMIPEYIEEFNLSEQIKDAKHWNKSINYCEKLKNIYCKNYPRHKLRTFFCS